jgi:hypothetical protein
MSLCPHITGVSEDRAASRNWFRRDLILLRAGAVGRGPVGHAGGDTDLDADGDRLLLGFSATLGVKNFKRNAVLLEYSGAAADLGGGGVRIRALSHREI